MSKPIAIIGAGISGLTAAHYLKKAGKKVIVIEITDRPGGRVKTDKFDGFLLDHGFQVLLTAYPEAKKVLDYSKLKLRYFQPGALIFNKGKKTILSDPFKMPSTLFSTLFSDAGTIADKLKILKLKKQLSKISIEEIFTKKELTTLEYLRNFGFSEKMIQQFFRPFLSGIYLEKELRTSSRMFEFVFKMFSEGDAAIPAFGIEEISKQLSEQLSGEELLTENGYKSHEGNTVILENGSQIEVEAIIFSFNKNQKDEWRSTTNLYFSSGTSPVDRPILLLNADKNSLVNNITVMSDVSGSYSVNGNSLISVTLIGDYRDVNEDKLVEDVKKELSQSFGNVDSWTLAKIYHIRKALPEIDSYIDYPDSESLLNEDGTYNCGDYHLNPSLNAAMKSGRLVAEKILNQ
ncbi:MAG: FAD-dependent oxidoreductase [Chitinophagaceae bacterium]|nr:MAG: FAD-dependent oxidoreductase [Chitinophagaceae bacterium]